MRCEYYIANGHWGAGTALLQNGYRGAHWGEVHNGENGVAQESCHVVADIVIAQALTTLPLEVQVDLRVERNRPRKEVDPADDVRQSVPSAHNNGIPCF
jgi:hypothetical protein